MPRALNSIALTFGSVLLDSIVALYVFRNFASAICTVDIKHRCLEAFVGLMGGGVHSRLNLSDVLRVNMTSSFAARSWAIGAPCLNSLRIALLYSIAMIRSSVH